MSLFLSHLVERLEQRSYARNHRLAPPGRNCPEQVGEPCTARRFDLAGDSLAARRECDSPTSPIERAPHLRHMPGAGHPATEPRDVALVDAKRKPKSTLGELAAVEKHHEGMRMGQRQRAPARGRARREHAEAAEELLRELPELACAGLNPTGHDDRLSQIVAHATISGSLTPRAEPLTLPQCAFPCFWPRLAPPSRSSPARPQRWPEAWQRPSVRRAARHPISDSGWLPRAPRRSAPSFASTTRTTTFVSALGS